MKQYWDDYQKPFPAQFVKQYSDTNQDPDSSGDSEQKKKEVTAIGNPLFQTLQTIKLFVII